MIGVLDFEIFLICSYWTTDGGTWEPRLAVAHSIDKASLNAKASIYRGRGIGIKAPEPRA